MSSMPSITDLLGLCKLKVVSLIMLTAVVGMLLAVPYLPNLLLVIIASAGIALSAMSAAVFNHIVDEKIDIQMSRTRRRPLPQGKVSRNQALIWGLFLGFLGIGLLLVYVNLLTAVLTFLSLIGYAVFYTMYLKRATPQNIVIGGAAGAAKRWQKSRRRRIFADWPGAQGDRGTLAKICGGQHSPTALCSSLV